MVSQTCFLHCETCQSANLPNRNMLLNTFFAMPWRFDKFAISDIACPSSLTWDLTFILRLQRAVKKGCLLYF